jgi:hypothetical protein
MIELNNLIYILIIFSFLEREIYIVNCNERNARKYVEKYNIKHNFLMIFTFFQAINQISALITKIRSAEKLESIEGGNTLLQCLGVFIDVSED